MKATPPRKMMDPHLVDIREVDKHLQILYDLLAERSQDQSISHIAMPTWEQHVAYVRRYPNFPKAWYLIVSHADGVVGATYITRQAEIGVFVFKAHQAKGYGRYAVEAVMDRWKKTVFQYVDKRAIPLGQFFAHIAPGNQASIEFFKHLGYYPIQVTLACNRS